MASTLRRSRAAYNAAIDRRQPARPGQEPLAQSDIFGLGSAGLTVLADVVSDLVTILDRSLTAEPADMDKDIRSPGVRGDEAEALVLIKKLYRSCCHVFLEYVGLDAFTLGRRAGGHNGLFRSKDAFVPRLEAKLRLARHRSHLSATRFLVVHPIKSLRCYWERGCRETLLRVRKLLFPRLPARFGVFTLAKAAC